MLVATGYFPQLTSFPLQRPGSAPTNDTRGCTTGAPIVVDGTAESAFNGVEVRRASGGRINNFFIDSQTRIVGMRRDGLPFIGNGQRVHIVAVPCRTTSGYTKLVARRISAAGPIVGQATASQALGDDWDGVSTPLSHSSVLWITALLMAAAAGAWALHRRVG